MKNQQEECLIEDKRFSATMKSKLIKKKKKNNRPDIVLKDYEKITFLLIDTLVPTDNMEVPVM